MAAQSAVACFEVKYCDVGVLAADELFVGLLLNVPATGKCISGTGQLMKGVLVWVVSFSFTVEYGIFFFYHYGQEFWLLCKADVMGATPFSFLL